MRSRAAAGHTGSVAHARRTTDPLLLRTLATAPDRRVRVAVAYNEATPTETLRLLADDADEVVLRAVAVHPRAEPEALRTLAQSHAPGVAARLARREHLPVDLLETLAAHPLADVRIALAWRRTCQPHVLARLAADPDEQVRQVAAGHRDLPAEAIQALAADASPGVKRALARRLAFAPAPAAMGEQDWAAVLHAADMLGRRRLARARDPLPSSVCLALAATPDKWTRCNLAERPDADPALLRALADDPDLDVRQRVARHARTDSETLTLLVTGRSAAVARQVFARPGAPEWLRTHPEPRARRVYARLGDMTDPAATALLRDPDPQVRRDIAERGVPALLTALADDRSATIRQRVAALTGDCQVLSALATDRAAAVRAQVAQNPATPVSTLTALAGDPDPQVRQRASQRFLHALTSAG